MDGEVSSPVEHLLDDQLEPSAALPPSGAPNQSTRLEISFSISKTTVATMRKELGKQTPSAAAHGIPGRKIASILIAYRKSSGHLLPSMAIALRLNLDGIAGIHLPQQLLSHANHLSRLFDHHACSLERS